MLSATMRALLWIDACAVLNNAVPASVPAFDVRAVVPLGTSQSLVCWCTFCLNLSDLAGDMHAPVCCAAALHGAPRAIGRRRARAQVRESVRRGVKDIIQRVGVTTVIVTHDQEEAFDIADRVVIFNRRDPRRRCVESAGCK